MIREAKTDGCSLICVHVEFANMMAITSFRASSMQTCMCPLLSTTRNATRRPPTFRFVWGDPLVRVRCNGYIRPPGVCEKSSKKTGKARRAWAHGTPRVVRSVFVAMVERPSSERKVAESIRAAGSPSPSHAHGCVVRGKGCRLLPKGVHVANDQTFQKQRTRAYSLRPSHHLQCTHGAYFPSLEEKRNA